MTGPRYILLIAALALCALGGFAGCGEEPAPPAPAAAAPKPTVPRHGVVYAEPLPSAVRLAERFAFDPLAEAHAWLLGRDDAERWVVEQGEQFNQPGRLRFYLKPAESLGDEEADVQAAARWDAVLAAVDARFQAELASHHKWLELEQATAREAMAAAQAELRDYLATRRGVPATAESRREQARLEYVLSKAVEALDALTERAEQVRDAVASPPHALRRTN